MIEVVAGGMEIGVHAGNRGVTKLLAPLAKRSPDPASLEDIACVGLVGSDQVQCLVTYKYNMECGRTFLRSMR